MTVTAQTHWVDTSVMAEQLGISTWTLARWRKLPASEAFLRSGVHYKLKTFEPNGGYLWNLEKVIAAADQRRKAKVEG